MIILTRELIDDLRTPAGGFNRPTIETVGICWPLSEGWQERAIGMKVSDRNWKAAQRAKDEKRHVFRGNTRSR